MGGGRVIQVATKEQWDKIMAENPGKAVSAPTGRAKADLLQVFGEEGTPSETWPSLDVHVVRVAIGSHA